MDDQAKLRGLRDIAFRLEYDEQFEQLAHGELSAEQEAALRSSPDPEVKRLYELFRPLDASFKRRFQTIIAEGKAPVPFAVVVGTASSDAPKARRRMQGWAVLAVGGALAAAAAVAILLRGEATDETAPPLRIASMERVVPHSSQGIQLGSSTSTHPAATMLRPGMCWHMQLIPPRSSRAPREVRAYFSRGETTIPWDTTFTILSNDTLEPVGGCAKIPSLPAGDWQLLVLSGNRLPTLGLEAIAKACQTPQPALSRWRCDQQSIAITSD